MKKNIRFNQPYYSPGVIPTMKQAFKNLKLCGDGEFSHRCSVLLEEQLKIRNVFLTPSGTSALEMGALLLGLKAGDEVIMPSYTFTSTANSVMVWGAQPVFADIDPQTLNLDEEKVRQVVSPATRAILPVHYAGCSCDMDKLMILAREKNLVVLEDAAQALFSYYRGQALGGIGDLGAISFHETKNFSCGEGGALLVNRSEYRDRAEIIREKGTDRSQFFRGEVDKYTWRDVGSSYLLSDLLAAYLYVQLLNRDQIMARRRSIFEYYYQELLPQAEKGYFRLPFIPEYNTPNYHIFYLILPDEDQRNGLMDYLKSNGILAIFHYVPLHLSQMGRRLGYQRGDFPVSEEISSCLVRLPLHYNLKKSDPAYIVNKIKQYYHQPGKKR